MNAFTALYSLLYLNRAILSSLYDFGSLFVLYGQNTSVVKYPTKQISLGRKPIRKDLCMLQVSAPLAATVSRLRSGQLDLLSYINEVCNRIDTVDPRIHALLPETNRRAHLMAEARAL